MASVVFSVDTSHGMSLLKLWRPTLITLQLDKAQIELLLLRQAQRKDFAEEYGALQTGKSVPSSSQLYNLAPEFDSMAEVIRVGG